MFSSVSLLFVFLVVIKKVTKEKNDTQTNPCGQPVIVLWRRRKCGCGCELTLREDLQPPCGAGQRLCDNMLLEVFFSFFLKKDVFPHFVLFFCCCCLLSMASDLRVFWCPCATACLKYISRKKKNNRGGKKVGRTLFCIFGLKSQLSGKQSSDCLVCLWNIFSFSSVTHTHISVWEHVCVLLSSVAKVAGCPPQPDGVLCEFGAGAAPLQFSCHQLALTALMSLTRFWARQIPKI